MELLVDPYCVGEFDGGQSRQMLDDMIWQIRDVTFVASEKLESLVHLWDVLGL